MKVSREGITLIKSLEGLSARARRAADGRWVIGYGHTASAREGATVGDAEAELLLQYDLLPVVAALNQTLTGPVNQRQFDALASYALSLGPQRFRASKVVEAVNAGRLDEAAEAIAADDEASALPPPAPLSLRRRGAERALFLSDPSRPLTLGDLLTAPLPFGQVADLEAPVAAAEASGAVETAAEPAEVAPFPAAVDAAAPVEAPRPEARPDARAEAVAALLSDAPIPGSVAAARPDARLTMPEPAEDLAEAGSFRAGDLTPEPPALPAEVAPSAGVTGGVAALAASVGLRAGPDAGGDVHETGGVLTGAGNDFARRAEEDTLILSRPRPGVVRHEPLAAEATRRGRTGQTVALLGLGALGFVTFGAALAAFRLAADRTDPGDQTGLVAWFLTLIAAACVGVAAHQLYQRFGAEAVLPQADSKD